MDDDRYMWYSTHFETSLSTRLLVTDGHYNQRSLFYYKLVETVQVEHRNFLISSRFYLLAYNFGGP
jgi:hypothetical protein